MSIKYKGKTVSGGSGTSFTPDETLTLSAENVLGVATPVQRVLTQAEFDALPEGEQKKGLYVIPGEGSGGSTSGGIPTGGIIIWSGASDKIPTGWALCDGQNGTPDLRDRFVLGAGTHIVGDTGGSETVTLTASEMPRHSHAAYANGGTNYISQVYMYRDSRSIGCYLLGGYIAEAGGDQPHPNMPPYYTLAYIMKL